MSTATATRKHKSHREAPEFTWAAMIEAALTVPGSLGSTYNRFYNYSFGNQVLLMMQGIAEPVATFKRWQELNRQVRKGSKAAFINRPIMRKRTDESTGEETYGIGGFKLVPCLFGYSATDPVDGTEDKPLPEPADESWKLERALSALNITEVDFDLTNGNVQGYSTGRTFAISPVAADPMKTIMHELGHIVCGHTEGDNRPEHRGVGEFQAEAVALLLGKELGIVLPEAQMRGYIQHWLQDGTRPAEAQIKTVFDAVNKILTAGREKTKEEERQ